jgi:nucleosome binding factor SPN SPT16 subunit
MTFSLYGRNDRYEAPATFDNITKANNQLSTYIGEKEFSGRQALPQTNVAQLEEVTETWNNCMANYNPRVKTEHSDAGKKIVESMRNLTPRKRERLLGSRR